MDIFEIVQKSAARPKLIFTEGNKENEETEGWDGALSLFPCSVF